MADAPACVNCRLRPVEPNCEPFCSERCRMADLGRWLGGEYRVAGTAEEDAAGQAAPHRAGHDSEDEPLET